MSAVHPSTGSTVTAPPPEHPGQATRRRVVVLASGSGTLLQALLDDMRAPADDTARPYEVVAVGSDLSACRALERAVEHDVPTFTERLRDHADRPSWDAALAARCAEFGADLVVLAGFMKLVGAGFLDAFDHRVLNAHPSLLPAFPGMHAPADALAHGVKLTGCTAFLVDTGVDAGPIVAQRAVPVLDDDTVETLHERIKVTERALLVEVVRALTAAPYRVDGRKVRLG